MNLINNNILNNIAEIDNLLDKKEIKYNLLKDQYIKIEKEFSRLVNMRDKSKEDTLILQRLNTRLKAIYDKFKVDIKDKLESQLSSVINSFFSDNIELKLKPDVQRGKNQVILELQKIGSNNKSVGDVDMILSDSQQQMVGALIQIILLRNMKLGNKNNFIVFDEAFSCFGNKEIQSIPKIMELMDNFQIVIIEHKEDLFDNLSNKVLTYHLNRDNKGETYIEEISNKETLIDDWSKYNGYQSDIIKERILNF